jgi:hypothetical protein
MYDVHITFFAWYFGYYRMCLSFYSFLEAGKKEQAKGSTK